jgi:hypothetical protein
MVTITLTPDEAVKLISICNGSYLQEESILANLEDPYARKRTRKSMATIQAIKEKVKTEILNGGKQQ